MNYTFTLKALKALRKRTVMFAADGEFGAEVYSGATTEKQAWEVFRPARLMVSRAATYRAQAEADATARSALADKASALDRQLAEGVGVVAELGGALKQRDAEVAALCDQVNIERGLSGDAGDQACGGQ